MFKKFVNGVKNLFGSVSSGFMMFGWDSLSRKAHNWLAWFNKSPRLKPLDKIASDIAAIDTEHVDDKGEPIKNSKALEMLNNPNHMPEFNRSTLFKLWTIHYDLVGEAFWLITEEEEILPIPPTWVKYVPKKTGDQYYKIITSEGTTFSVPKDKMVYWKNLDPVEPYGRGVGNAAQIGDELQVDEYMSKHQQLTFQNGAMPPVIASIEGSTRDQRERFKMAWQEQFGGLKKSHTIGTIDGKTTSIQVLQQTMKDLDFIDSRKFTKEQVNQHYMIPPELMGQVENSNRATITSAQKIYEQNALKPRLSDLYEGLNTQFLVIIGEKGILQPESYGTADKEFVYEDANKGWDNGMYTKNEARAMKGLDPVSGGDVFKSRLGEQMLPASGAKSMEVLEVPDIIEVDFVVEDPKEKYWRTVDKAAESQEEDAAKSLAKYFKKQGKRIQDAIKEADKSLTKADNPFDVQWSDIDIDWSAEEAMLIDVLNPIWLKAVLTGSELVDEVYSFGISFDLIREEWLAFIEDQGFDQLRAEQITDTTKKLLKQALQEGIKEGESINQIAERVQQIIDHNESVRSQAIARTETHTATVAGTYVSYQTAGVERMEWLVSYDGRERDWHGTMGGQIRNTGEPFVSGLGNLLLFPGDPSAPAEEVVNCRCAIAPVF